MLHFTSHYINGLSRRSVLLFQEIHVFFMSKKCWNWQKIKQKLSNTVNMNFCYLKIIRFLHWRYHPKIIGDILKIKKIKHVCLNKVIWLMTIKMRLKMKNRLHRYKINRPRPRHGHKYTIYKICLGIMMTICIKRHLSNT